MLYSPVPSPLYYFNNINDNAIEFENQPYDMPQRENNELEKVLPQIFPEPHLNDDTELKSNDYNKTNKSQDEQLNENNFKTIDIKGKNINIPLENLNLNGSVLTRATSKVLGIKTKRSDENIEENKDNKKKGGRKKKDEKEKGDHTKFCEDNLMRKIKSNYLEFIHNSLNDSFKNKNYKFLRLYSEINENLKKDYNMELMHKTIKELYENSPISCKYRKQKINNSDINKNLIEELYNEPDIDKKEIEVINLLNLTYLDLLKIFRTVYLENFLAKIAKEERSKGEIEENIQDYVKRIKELCLDYENWFEKKNGRKRIKKNKNN